MYAGIANSAIKLESVNTSKIPTNEVMLGLLTILTSLKNSPASIIDNND